MTLIFALFFALNNGEVDLEQLTREFDQLYRSESSEGEISMSIVTPNYQRTLVMSVWSKGMDYTLVRIQSPRKEKGVATLKRETEMWNYLPKIRKTIRIPPSMMMGSWMGSDFTNDDLMRESTWSEDYAAELGPEEAGKIVIVYNARPDAPVAWPKVVARFDEESHLPLELVFYDEKDRAVRKMTYSEVDDLGGRRMPTKMTLTPLLKENQRTEVHYREMAFDVSLPDQFFSLSNLKRDR
jgi:outer membrane lipoprotein-sorting protein